jgi:hypothetical protein
VAALELDALEALGDLRRPVLVARQQDVFGQLAPSQVDVVLLVGIGQADRSFRNRRDPPWATLSACGRADPKPTLS